MQNDDEPNLLKVLDETESYRRERQAELNQGLSREEIQIVFPGTQVYSTDELRAEFEVVGFFAPLVVVKSKADGSLGSFEFQHSPRFFFNYKKDEE